MVIGDDKLHPGAAPPEAHRKIEPECAFETPAAFRVFVILDDTGILGNRFVVSQATLRTMGEHSLDPALVRKLSRKVFAFDEAGLAALRQSGLKSAVVKEIEEKLSGKTYASEKNLFAALKSLKNRPRSFKDRKTVSKTVVSTIMNR